MTGQEKGKLFGETLGMNIRKYRMKRGLSINDLAEYAMLDEKNLGRIERGERTPRTDTLVKIAIVLKVSPNKLLEGTKKYLETIPEEYWKKKR